MVTEVDDLAATRKASTRVKTSEGTGEALGIDRSRSLGYMLRDCSRRFSKALEEVIRPYGIRVGQWYFLRELWAEDGLTQVELSLRAGMSAPTTVVAIRGMVEAGLVVRKPHNRDRRKVRIFLTREGRRYRDELLPRVLDINAVATKGFTRDEVRQFRSLVDRINGNLSER